MGAMIFGLLVVCLALFIFGYGIVSIAKDKNIPLNYITIPIAVIAGLFVMSLLRML